jgi:hypothetical protein
MAKGYPDYFGQSVWPKYGPLQFQGILSPDVLAGATTTLFSIAAQSIGRHGRMRLINVTNPTKVSMQLTVDGTLVLNYTLTYLFSVFGHGGAGDPIVVLNYDVIGQTFDIEFGVGLAIGQGMALAVFNNLATDIAVAGRLTYYQVK